MKPRVVFDTNIYISASIFGGNPKDCILLAQQKHIALYTSKPLLLELSKTLHKKFKWEEYKIDAVIQGISVFADITTIREKITTISADPSDNAVLEVAVEAQADYIVSGDKRHILPLKKYKNTQIITAARFLEIIDN